MVERGIVKSKLLLQFELLLPVRSSRCGRRSRRSWAGVVRLASIIMLLVGLNLPRNFGEGLEGSPIPLHHREVDGRAISLGRLCLLASRRGLADAMEGETGIYSVSL
jgi:hypothetical protein